VANSAVVGILRVLLTADSAEYDAAMKRSGETAKVWSRDMKRIGDQATAIGATLTKAITLPLVGLGLAAGKAAMDFESSFAGVRKTVDATEPEFAALAAGLRGMAKEIPTTVNELNRVAEAAGQLGVKKDDLLPFVRTMADLGETTNLTAEEAATATAQFQNIFGAAGKDVDRFGATLVALGNDGASTEKSIIDMGLRIAGAGNQIRITQAQTLSYASALSSVGINAEAGGSAISRTFLKINDAVMAGGPALSEFARVAGMTGTEFKAAFERDAATAVASFISGLARLKEGGENVNTTLEGLVGKNIIIKDTLLRASGAGDLLTRTLALGNQAWQQNTALTNEAAVRYGTFESQAGKLRNQVYDVGVTLGTALLPALKDMIAVIQPLVGWVAGAAAAFAMLPEPVRLATVGALGLAAAAGPVIWAFGQLATGAGVLLGAFTSKGLAVVALTNAYAAMGRYLPTLTGLLTGLQASLALSTTQVSALGLALSGLGSIVAVVGAAFAGWKIGEWAGEVSGLTDWVGKKLAGAFYGVSEAEYAATAAALKAHEARKQQTPEVKALEAAQRKAAEALAAAGTAAAGAAPPLRIVTEVTKEQAAAAKKAAEETDRLAQEYREFYNWLGERQMEDAAAVIQAAEDKASAEREYQNFVAERRLEAEGAELARIDREAAAWREYYNWLGERRMEADAAAMQSANGFGKAWEGIASKLPKVLMAAFTGGGDVGKSIGALVGGQFAEAFQKQITEVLGKVLSQKLAEQLGEMIPVVGQLLGSKLGKMFDNFWGFLTKREGRQVNDLRDEFTAAAGGIDALNAKVVAAGGNLREFFAADTVKEWEQAVRNLQGVLGEHEQQLELAKAAAEEFGIPFERMGQAFKQGETDLQGSGLLEKIDALIESGVDLGTVIEFAGDDVGRYIQRCIEAGTTVPKELRGIAEEMIRQGKLIDANGDAFTDLGQIPFAEGPVEALGKIADKLDILLRNLFGIGDAAEDGIDRLDNALRGFRPPVITVPVKFEGDTDGLTPGNGIPGGSVPGLAAGGLVTGPTLALIGEAGPELVTPLDRVAEMQGAGLSLSDMRALTDRFARTVTSQVDRLEGILAITVRDAMQGAY
jgi:TP901 family phage tail tape measure protein